MRHLGSLVLSLIAGALIYVLLGVTFVKWGEALGESGGSKYGDFAIALGAVLVAGGLYSILVLARVSPLGLVLLGLLYYVVAFWAFFSLSSFTDLMPRSIAGVEGAGYAAAGPDLILVGTPLLATIFSPRRWRRYGSAPAAVAPAPGYSPPPVAPGGYQAPAPVAGGFGTPTYGSPNPSTPTYGSPSPSTPTYGSPSPTYGSPSPSTQNYAPSTQNYASPTSGSPYSAPPYSPVSPAYGSPEPASPAGSYASSQPPYSSQPPVPEPGLPPLPLPPPEDPEATRRL
jgi:hypothetical protein